MIFFQFLYCYNHFKSDHGYRIKLAGDEELYLAKVNHKMRLVDSKKLNQMDDLISVARLEKTYDDLYYINFCGENLSSKSTDPGIIPRREREYRAKWEIRESTRGYRIAHGNKCLVKIPGIDEPGIGYYLNEQFCNDQYPDEFSILDMGYIVHYCSKFTDEICERRKDNFYNRKARDKYGDNDWVNADIAKLYDTYTNKSYPIYKKQKRPDDRSYIDDRDYIDDYQRLRDADRDPRDYKSKYDRNRPYFAPPYEKREGESVPRFPDKLQLGFTSEGDPTLHYNIPEIIYHHSKTLNEILYDER